MQLHILKVSTYISALIIFLLLASGNSYAQVVQQLIIRKPTDTISADSLIGKWGMWHTNEFQDPLKKRAFYCYLFYPDGTYLLCKFGEQLVYDNEGEYGKRRGNKSIKKGAASDPHILRDTLGTGKWTLEENGKYIRFHDPVFRKDTSENSVAFSGLLKVQSYRQRVLALSQDTKGKEIIIGLQKITGIRKN